jgi:hypothetical protein
MVIRRELNRTGVVFMIITWVVGDPEVPELLDDLEPFVCI